ncbi:MAG: HTH-type transcriptional regulator McbR [Desulfovibrio sp.]
MTPLSFSTVPSTTESPEWQTKSERVYHHLRDEITKGALRPDDRLVVSTIAQQLKVSPMPVREALNRLIQEGMVDVTPHTGARVASVNLVQLCEIAYIRRELETLAAKLAVPQMDDELFTYLDELLHVMKSNLGAESAHEYEKINLAFHRAIYSCCGNQSLYELVMSLWEKSSITRTSLVRFPDQNRRSYEEHVQWIAAAKQGDAEKVAEIVREHLRATVDKLIAELSKQT